MDDEKPVMEAIVEKKPIFNVTTLNDGPLGEVIQHEVSIAGFKFVVEED